MSDTFLSPLTILGAGGCFAFSSVFYYLYKEKKIEIKKLKEIPSFQVDQHLLKILKASPSKRLHYVAVEGVVQAVGEALASKFEPRCYGVIQKITTMEHWKMWNANSQLWDWKKHNGKTKSVIVPFQLVQPGTYLGGVHVNVSSPLEASGDYLEEVHRSMKQTDDGLLDAVVQNLSGQRFAGLEQREEMLRVGSALTGYGEVVLEGGDTIQLRPPRDGRAYVFIPGGHQGLIRRHETSATFWKELTVVSGIAGTTLLTMFVCSALNKDKKGS